MRLAFHKMHGLGNDFVIVDSRDADIQMTEPLARAFANRRTGIGCDQLIILEDTPIADVKMRIFNADGGEVEACGNAARCIVSLLGQSVSIATSGGVISGRAEGQDIQLDMGSPSFEWDQIPLADPMDTLRMPVAWDGLEHPSAVNVGNPHLVFFVDDITAVDLARIGPVIENDPLFPERVNINVAQVEEDGNLSLRVWERGAGLTRACGTGACATMVAAVRTKRAAGDTIVHLPGGDLTVGWTPGETVTMCGPASHVFEGVVDPEVLM
jgi:diaminopimelate epimerase